MINLTKPVFILGSGRSGTRLLYKLLSGHTNLEVYHEYGCTHIQPVAAKYHMGLMNKSQTKEAVMKVHGAAIFYSRAERWIDCSNKLSWIVEPLYELFPRAIFIHVIRDGRKVVNSYFHKLGPEMYPDEAVNDMIQWLKKPRRYPEPPPEKKYWWNIPQKSQAYFKDFPSFSRFQRICYHWDEAIKTVNTAFKKIPKKNQFEFRLEELTKNKSLLKKFMKIFEIPYEDHYFKFIQQPQNVFFPMDLKMTGDQQKQFNLICGNTLKKLKYPADKIYEVKY